MKPAGALLLSVMLLAISNQSAVAEKALTGKDFREKMVEKTLTWKQGKNHGTVRFSRSGKILITISTNKKLPKDTGKWKWKNGQNCTIYKNIRKGKERCTTIYFDGPGFRGPHGSVLRYK
ncbi:MAG: hypothetical protein OIF54_14250 [Cohaesibacter sp.]|nr:hypothetical protein [Cohaesibacter sp.]